jgi:hypothetical protein
MRGAMMMNCGGYRFGFDRGAFDSHDIILFAAPGNLNTGIAPWYPITSPSALLP